MKENEQRKQYAQELRKNATKEERLLWNAFLQKYDVQFRRQCVLGQYIVDFYCAKASLVVELDGSQHYDPVEQERDRIRSAYLESLGLQVLRFSNLEVTRQFESVCQAIDLAVKERFREGPTPIGVGRRAFSTEYYARVKSPHPPPEGAPSPKGKGFRTEELCLILNLRSRPYLVLRV